MRLGPKIRWLRSELGYSQQDIAAALGLSQYQVSKWESGKNKPGISQMRTLAEIFHVSLDYLADDTLDEPPLVMTADERDLLEAMRRSGLTPVRVLEELVRAGLIRELPSHPGPGPDRGTEPVPTAPKRSSRRKPKRSS